MQLKKIEEYNVHVHFPCSANVYFAQYHNMCKYFKFQISKQNLITKSLFLINLFFLYAVFLFYHSEKKEKVHRKWYFLKMLTEGRWVVIYYSNKNYFKFTTLFLICGNREIK